MYACQSCGLRWEQDGGVCRRCAQVPGVWTRQALAQDRTRLVRQQALAATARRVPASELQPRDPRAVTIGGRGYLVMWDGT